MHISQYKEFWTNISKSTFPDLCFGCAAVYSKTDYQSKYYWDTFKKMNKTLSKIWTKQLRSNFRKNFVHFLEGINVRRFGFDISWPFNKHQKNAWFKWESNYVPKLIVQKIDYQGFLLVCSHSKFLSTTTFRNSQETFFGRMLMFWWQECAVTCCCIYHNFKSFKWGLFDLIVKIKILS